MWCYQAYLVAYKLFYYGTRFKVLPSVWGTRILYNHRIVAIHGNVTLMQASSTLDAVYQLRICITYKCTFITY